MFHTRITRCQSYAVLNRRSKKRKPRCRPRRAFVEMLEPRQMLSAAPFDLGILPAMSLVSDDHGREHAPPGLAVAQARIENHWIKGESFTFVAEPTSREALDAEDSSSPASDALYPLTSLPQLHSNPSAHGHDLSRSRRPLRVCLGCLHEPDDAGLRHRRRSDDVQRQRAVQNRHCLANDG